MIKEANTPDQVKFWLQSNIGMKIGQRHDQGVEGYWVRAESVQEQDDVAQQRDEADRDRRSSRKRRAGFRPQ